MLWNSFQYDIVYLNDDDFVSFIVLASLTVVLLLYPKSFCAWICCCLPVPNKTDVAPEGEGESDAILQPVSRYRLLLVLLLQSDILDRARLLVGWACFYLAARALTFGESGYEVFGQPFKDVMHRTASVPLVFSVVRLLLSFVDFSVLKLKILLQRIEGGASQSNIDIADVVRDIGKGLVYLAFLMFLLGYLTDNMNGLSNNLTLGASAVIAFGLHNIVTNFYGLSMIIFDKPFRLWDHISIGGIEGFVAKVGMRCFIIKGFDGSYHYVPNAHILSNPVQNFYTCTETKQVVEFTLSYGTDSAVVFGSLRDALLVFFRGKQFSWVDIMLDLKPRGVSYRLTYKYPKGEALARTVDPNWNFYLEAMDFRAAAIVHICDEVRRFDLMFAAFPKVVEAT